MSRHFPPCFDPVFERGTIAQMYHDRDTFDFIQGHVTKNQPMTVPVSLSESHRNITKQIVSTYKPNIGQFIVIIKQ